MSSDTRFRVAIIGGGIAGIAQAISLQKRLGHRVDITIFEKADAIGGVWRDARWPGAGVDVPIHFYALWSEPKSDWTQHYAEQAEVLAYWESLVDKHQLRSRVRLRSEYVGSEWDEERHVHVLTIRCRDGGKTYRHEANVLIGANGPLSTPQIPNIPGLDEFKGESFHNLRWRTDVEMRGKRVAVVGNGSSGVQLVPGVAALPGVHLTHFIRSGGYFVPKNNYRYGKWTIWLFKHVPLIQRLHRLKLFLDSNNRWRAKQPSEAERQAVDLLAYLKQEAPVEYHSALLPDYPLGCKRVAYDAGWLKSLHRPNVDLNRSKIVKATPRGLCTEDGREHAFDVIIFATGSNVAEHGVGVNIGLRGEQGVELRERWRSWGGPKAYLGTAVPGFPNYLIILGPNGIAGSWGYTIGVKTEFNTLLIETMLNHGITSIQPNQGAFDRHNQFIQDKLAVTNMNSQACHNWWRVGGQGLLTVPNAVTGLQFARITQTIRWHDWCFTRLVPGDKPVAVDVVQELSRKKKRWIAAGGSISLVIASVFTWRSLL